LLPGCSPVPCLEIVGAAALAQLPPPPNPQPSGV